MATMVTSQGQGKAHEWLAVRLVKTYYASFKDACMLLPTFALLTTGAIYLIAPGLSITLILFYGAVLGCGVIVVIACFRYAAATPEGGNAQNYILLDGLLNEVDQRLQVAEEMKDLKNNDVTDLVKECGWKEAKKCRDDAEEKLWASRGGQWISGEGYAYMSRMIRRAQEALIEVEPLPMLIRDAVNDLEAIEGSNISNRERLAERLKQAIKILDGGVATYLSGDEGCKDDTPAGNGADAQALARAMIRQVTYTLNEFRVNRLSELIQQRNNLVLSIVATGAITYLLLCFGLQLSAKDIAGDPRSVITAAAIYYIVGAAGGLFGRLYSESKADRAINDYGLALTRLVTIPVLSGLAGIGGVFITMAVISVIGRGTTFGLSSTNLIIAATFGFTPNLVIRNLQQQSEKSISDLNSIKGSESKVNAPVGKGAA